MPTNRPIKKLWEICKFQNWFAFQSNLFKEIWEPILRISNIQNNWFSDNRLVFFNPKDYEKNLDDYLVSPWDLVIAMSWATTWKLAINDTDKKYYLNQRVWKFIFDNDITKKRCHLFLSTKIESNLQQSAWSAIPNLSTEQIKSIEIPLPPLATQQLIVAKLDEAFAQIDEAIATTQANIDQTDELTKSVLDKVFEEGEWEKVKLWNICKFQNWFAFQSNLFKEKGEPILRISNIQNNWFSDNRLVFFNPKDYDKNLDDYLVYPWDLVIAMSWATTWKLAINNTDKKYYLNQRVWKFVFDDDVTKKRCHLFLSTKIEENLKQSVGSAIPNLSTEQIKNIEIPLPSIAKQQEIVSYLDHVFAQSSQLKEQYQKKLVELKELKASVLQSAFEGKLV